MNSWLSRSSTEGSGLHHLFGGSLPGWVGLVCSGCLFELPESASESCNETAQCAVFETCYVFDEECGPEPEGGVAGRFKCELDDDDFRGLSDISGLVDLSTGLERLTFYWITTCTIVNTEDFGRVVRFQVQSDPTFTTEVAFQALVPLKALDDGGRFELPSGLAFIQQRLPDNGSLTIAESTGGEIALSRDGDTVEGYVEVDMEAVQ